MTVSQEQSAGNAALIAALEATARDVIAVKRAYVDICGGDHLAALALTQIVYWHAPYRDGRPKLTTEKDGAMWLVRGDSDWWQEARLKPKQARRVVKTLVELGLVEKRIFKAPGGAPTAHLRLEREALANALMAWVEAEMGHPPIRPNGQMEMPKRANGSTPSGQMEMPPTGTPTYIKRDQKRENTSATEKAEPKKTKRANQKPPTFDALMASPFAFTNAQGQRQTFPTAREAFAAKFPQLDGANGRPHMDDILVQARAWHEETRPWKVPLGIFNWLAKEATRYNRAWEMDRRAGKSSMAKDGYHAPPAADKHGNPITFSGDRRWTSADTQLCAQGYAWADGKWVSPESAPRNVRGEWRDPFAQGE